MALGGDIFRVILEKRGLLATTERIEKVESEITQMSAEELDAFRAWFAEFDADAWDRQFEADVQAGKLDHLAAEAMREYQAGLTTEL